MSNAIATWIVAGAAIANLLVYFGLWLETRKQIILTRDIFVESHKPILSVSISKCEYSEAAGLFKGRIIVTNHGAATAHQVTLRIQFAPLGSQGLKDIGPVVIQPKNKIRESFYFSMMPDTYERGKIKGNHLTVRIDGSYQGASDKTKRGPIYGYGELLYNVEGCRFVPIWSG